MGQCCKKATDLIYTSPAFERNKDPLVEVLQTFLPDQGWVLETASGPGQHLMYFSEKFPNLNWQGSDVEPAAVASIEAWARELQPSNLRQPLLLDMGSSDWIQSFQKEPNPAAVLSINMSHISPWSCTRGLVQGASELLAPGGYLFFYGPWLEKEVETAPSNLQFDAYLKSQNSDWGIKKVEDLLLLTGDQFQLQARKAMPANNISMLFCKN